MGFLGQRKIKSFYTAIKQIGELENINIKD